VIPPVPVPSPIFPFWLAGAEVDLLLERDGRLHPIEVELGSHPSRRDLSGIAAFRATYPRLDVAPALVIAPVEQKERLNENTFALPREWQ
jgi:hypothetical protein